MLHSVLIDVNSYPMLHSFIDVESSPVPQIASMISPTKSDFQKIPSLFKILPTLSYFVLDLIRTFTTRPTSCDWNNCHAS